MKFVWLVSVLRGKLSEVDALRDLRMELESQKAVSVLHDYVLIVTFLEYVS